MTRIGFCVWIALTLSACGGNDSPTSPSTPAPPALNSPSVTEVWENTLAVGAARFFSYSVGLNGTVNITLASLTERGVESSAELGIGWGTPSGTGCSVSSPTLVRAGTEPQVSTTAAPGIYCVRVSDPGNLTAPAAFRILIAHP
ncbi:MAG: hypothetical protein ACKVOX_08325 [Rhizobacter sp.]